MTSPTLEKEIPCRISTPPSPSSPAAAAESARPRSERSPHAAATSSSPTPRPEQDAHEVAASIDAQGRKAIALRLDAGDVQSFGTFAKDVGAALERTWSRSSFDHLVHNGGFGDGFAPFTDTTEASFDALLGVHFKGPFFLTQRLLPLLADGGRIVHVSSGVTRYAVPYTSVYAAAKSALEALTRSLALELAPRRITVNTVAHPHRLRRPLPARSRSPADRHRRDPARPAR